MSRRPADPTPGPADEDGAFLLLDDDGPPEELSPSALADGSDVHDVENLGAQLDAQSIDAVLQDYLNEADRTPPEPPPPDPKRE